MPTPTTTVASDSPAKLSTTIKDADGNPWTIESTQMDGEEFVNFVKRHKNRVEILKSVLKV
jgi:ABC-type iron transport system FetAB ATPase subunit